MRVTAAKLKEPARLGDFVIEVECPLELTEEQRLGVERSVKHCLIHNTLLSPPKIDLAIKSAVGASEARL